VVPFADERASSRKVAQRSIHNRCSKRAGSGLTASVNLEVFNDLPCTAKESSKMHRWRRHTQVWPETLANNGAALSVCSSRVLKTMQFPHDVLGSFGAASKEVMEREHGTIPCSPLTSDQLIPLSASARNGCPKSDAYYVEQTSKRVLGKCKSSRWDDKWGCLGRPRIATCIP